MNPLHDEPFLASPMVGNALHHTDLLSPSRFQTHPQTPCCISLLPVQVSTDILEEANLSRDGVDGGKSTGGKTGATSKYPQLSSQPITSSCGYLSVPDSLSEPLNLFIEIKESCVVSGLPQAKIHQYQSVFGDTSKQCVSHVDHPWSKMKCT
eukprot:PhF_6_TR31625/c0_g1_i1/m.46612